MIPVLAKTHLAGQAEELHEQIRSNAATLKPGSEMVQSCADLQEAQNHHGKT